jgi:hypothetical protein
MLGYVTNWNCLQGHSSDSGGELTSTFVPDASLGDSQQALVVSRAIDTRLTRDSNETFVAPLKNVLHKNVCRLHVIPTCHVYLAAAKLGEARLYPTLICACCLRSPRAVTTSADRSLDFVFLFWLHLQHLYMKFRNCKKTPLEHPEIGSVRRHR